MFGSCHSWSPIHTTDGILVDNRKLGVDEKGEHPILINKEDQRTNHPSISKKGSLQTTVKCFPGMTTGKLEINLWEEGYSLEASTIEDVKKKKKKSLTILKKIFICLGFHYGWNRFYF